LTFDFRTSQPIIPIRVNGGPPVPFLFDTGASVNVIDERVAREANLRLRGESVIRGGGQAGVPARFADDVIFEATTVAWSAQHATVVPIGYPDRKHFAGFIGAPVLARYVVQFDFGRRLLRLFEPGTYTPPARAMRMRFELQDHLPVVRAVVDAGSGPLEARLMLDTGAGDAFVDLNRPFVEAHRLLEAVPDAVPEARPAGIGGMAAFVYGTGRRVELGGMRFEAPRLGLSRASGGSSARAERDGIIGNALMGRFVVTFDYPQGVVTFERPGTE
jgi:hypothetical protein